MSSTKNLWQLTRAFAGDKKHKQSGLQQRNRLLNLDPRPQLHLFGRGGGER
jgi:hypothetical protein